MQELKLEGWERNYEIYVKIMKVVWRDLKSSIQQDPWGTPYESENMKNPTILRTSKRVDETETNSWEETITEVMENILLPDDDM